MYALVNVRRNGSKQFALGRVVGQRVEEVVYARGTMVVYLSLIANDSCAHTLHIVLLSLLPTGIIPLQLKLASLEPVARIELIGYGKRYYMQLLEPFFHCAFASHSHHLQYALLGAVIAVLRPTLTLGNPDVVVLGRNDEVHIFRQSLACRQHFPHACAALHYERLVYPHQILNPRCGQQVVAYGNLAGGLEAGINKQLVKQSRVEHYVAMVAYESVAAACINCRDIYVTPFGGLFQQFFKEAVAESKLKLKVGVALAHLPGQCFKGNVGEDVANNCAKLRVGKQSLVYGGQLLWLERAYGVELCGYVHK